jgi:uncharacterized protein YecE (DUF72 family)
MSNGRITVGTSSWVDPGFVAEWYPPGLAARDRLAWYAQRFETVEVNSSFYALPELGTVARWARVTPGGFTFDVKLHRLLSRHATTLDALPPDLRDGARTTGRGRVVFDSALERAMAARTLEVFEPLRAAGKLGAFLLQLSPSFSPYDHRLAELEPLLDALAPHQVAIELRRRSWVEGERTGETLRWYEDVGAAFVCVDAPPGDAPTIMPRLDAVTRPDLAYVRVHGRNTEGYLHGTTVAERFGYAYAEDELRELAGRARELAATAALVRMHFNNNSGADAPNAARRLRELLGQDAGPPAVAAQGRLV